MSNRDELPLGMVRTPNGLGRADTPWPLFGVILGGSQRGKSEYSFSPFLHQALIRREGGIFVDPSSTAIAKLKRFLGAEGVRERVREISRDPDKPQLSYNPFDVTGLTPGQVADKASAFVDMYTVVQGWNFGANARAINLTHQSVSLLLALNRRLPPHLQATIFQIPTLLYNDPWRKLVLEAVPERQTGFWLNEFSQIKKEASPPITHRLNSVREDPALRALLGASRSNFSLRQAMDERLIVLADIGKPGIPHTFLANLLLHDLVAAFFSRGEKIKEPRFVFVLDELQTYDGATNGSVADLLEGTAKFGGRGFALTQHFMRLASNTQKALLANRRLMVCFTLEMVAAKSIAADWLKGPDASVLPNLPAYEAIVDTEVSGHRAQFKVRTLPAERLWKAHLNDAAVPALQERLDGLGRSSEDVSRELDTLEERITDHLRSLGIVAASEGPDNVLPMVAE
jgi:hypothetical protein